MIAGSLLAASVLAMASGCAFTAKKTPRSATQVAAFKLLNPCPSTDQPRGSCPGYIVDHIKSLACGGPDAPLNMQWQSTAEAKAKYRWERQDCR